MTPKSSLDAMQACAAEPIRTPGSIQPHGVLLVLDGAGLVLRRASANCESILVPDALGQPLAEVLLADPAGLVADLSGDVPRDATVTLRTMTIADRLWTVVAHRAGPDLIVEFEETLPGGGSLDTLYPRIRRSVEALQAATTLDDLFAAIAQEVRALTGFDRVLVYRFDADANGTVVAEDRNEVLPSYLDLRFPASDIPAQARDLYRLNRLRLIPDAGYAPVPILPDGGVDLSFSVLRSVSPVHAEYMRNMGTGASMSISVVEEGRLWGLVSCHNAAPRRVPVHVRNACDFLGQIAAMLIAVRSRSAETAERVMRHAIEARLLAFMASDAHFIQGLVRHPQDVLALVDAEGAALVFDGRCHLLGTTPVEEDVRNIGAWLNSTQPHETPFATDAFADHMPGAEAFADTASGVLAISVSQLHASHIIWFRPEVVRTVTWAGDPRKDVGQRLTPRKSFEMWRELVRRRSAPWTVAQVETVRSLRNAITDIVLRKAEEMAALTEELSRSNRELEAFSYSVSHDLRAPFRHIVGYAELLKEEKLDLDPRGERYLDTIIESAFSAGRLVDDLLNFSQMGRATLTPVPIDMNRLVNEVRRMLRPETEGRAIEWQVAELAPGMGDPSFLRSVWQNLLGNAIKYTRERDPAVIEVGSVLQDGDAAWFVRDNGAGFDMAYADKLFGVFQRLHRMEDYEGSGIGLANVRRIVERHGGKTWAEGTVGKGATFYFSLPGKMKEVPWQS